MANRRSRTHLSLGGALLLALLAGCATPASLATPQVTDSSPVWLKLGIAQGLPLEDPLQLSAASKHRLQLEASEAGGERTQMKKLLRFLIDTDGLAFQYRPSRTLNAEAAFQAREGDCMSYAMLYVASARSLGIPVHFVRITQLPVFWEDGGRFFTSSHIAVEFGHDSWQEDAMVVDFSATHTSEWRVSLYDPIDDETAFVLFHSNRAVEYLLKDDYVTAEHILRFLLDHAPQQAEVYSNLGIVLMRLKRYQEATDLYATAIARFPRFVPLYTNAVNAATASGNVGMVKLWSAAGRKVAKADPAFAFGEGMLAFRQGDYPAAAERFSQALEVNPDDITLLAWTARAYLSAGDTAHGLLDVESIRHLTPSSAQRAMLNALREEFPKAGINLPAAVPVVPAVSPGDTSPPTTAPSPPSAAHGRIVPPTT
jgi:tetratricopeptide (TPR) repeat protein